MSDERSASSVFANLVRRTVRVVAALAVAACVGESVARLYLYEPRSLDPEFGYVIADGATTTCFKEGAGIGHWGPRGVRRTGLPAERGAPLLVLGDSFTEAVHVNDEECYTGRLARILAAGAPSMRVLNAGVAGRSAADYVHLAPAYTSVFRPEWTVVQMTSADLGHEAFDPGSTHFELVAGGRLRTVALPPAGRGGGLRRALRALRARSALLANASIQIRSFETLMTEFRPFHQSAAPAVRVAANDASFPVELELGMLREAFGSRLTLLFLGRYGTREEDATELRVRRYCAETGSSCVFLRDAFARFDRAAGPPYGFPNTGFGTGHLNATGHREAARLVADELTRLARRGLL
ncbi:MAG: SGNH/GDSL hydrolase family protein [Polyangiales bacterium]